METANQTERELIDALNYSISHDLRGQLMVINAFSTILTEEYQNKLDDDGKLYLSRIVEASNRMAEIIRNLLTFSKTMQMEPKKMEIDLSKMAKRISEELQCGAPERKADFSIAENGWICADPDLMRVVLENLFRNAWKFTAGRSRAVIDFRHQTNGEKTCFYIRDNGVGFNQAEAGKLFDPFVRLHSKKEFPGTGIGLAIIRRIIERHGGTVWAEGAVDEGATIHFELPKANSGDSGS